MKTENERTDGDTRNRNKWVAKHCDQVLATANGNVDDRFYRGYVAGIDMGTTFVEAPTAQRAGALDLPNNLRVRKFISHTDGYDGVEISQADYDAIKAALRNTELDKGLIVPNSALEAWTAIRKRQFEFRLHRNGCPKFVEGPANTDVCSCEVAVLEAALTAAPAEATLFTETVTDEPV